MLRVLSLLFLHSARVVAADVSTRTCDVQCSSQGEHKVTNFLQVTLTLSTDVNTSKDSRTISTEDKASAQTEVVQAPAVAESAADVGLSATSDRGTPQHVTGKPAIFVHIHKAAGTTLCNLAMTNHEATESFPLDYACNARFDTYANWDELLLGRPGAYDEQGFRTHQVSCEERLHHVQKHGITYAQIERAFDDEDYCEDMFQYGVLLRDPLSLEESMANFDMDEAIFNKTRDCYLHPSQNHDCKQFWDEWSANSPTQMMMTKGDDVAWYLQNMMYQPWVLVFDNFMVRVLGGREVMALPPHGVNETHLQRAMAVLSKFQTVGRVEDIGTAGFNRTFQQDLGWQKFDVDEQVVNAIYESRGQVVFPQDDGAGNAHEHAFQFSEEEKRELRILNRFDQMLYNSVKPL